MSKRPSHMQDFAETVALEMRRTSPVDRFPVHLHSIARRLGVQEIRFEAMSSDGRVVWSEGIPAIAVRDDMSPFRKRFTLAHELAHVMLGHGGVRYRDGANTTALDEQEKLCDAVAAALLMPKERMEKMLEGGVDWHAVISVSKELQVSRQSLVNRLADLSPRTLVYAELYWGEGAWHVDKLNGIARWSFASSRLRNPSVVAKNCPERRVGQSLLRFDCGDYSLDARGLGERQYHPRSKRWRAQVLITSVRLARDSGHPSGQGQFPKSLGGRMATPGGLANWTTDSASEQRNASACRSCSQGSREEGATDKVENTSKLA